MLHSAHYRLLHNRSEISWVA